MMQMRTHTCGELRLGDAGKSVKIVGWMENVREVGSNFAFVVLRDFYGTTQVVIESEESVPWTLDGEFGGEHTHVEITNNQRAVEIRMPEEVRDALVAEEEEGY